MKYGCPLGQTVEIRVDSYLRACIILTAWGMQCGVVLCVKQHVGHSPFIRELHGSQCVCNGCFS